MAGLVFLADFFGWTAQEAAEAYIFRSDVQYALNLGQHPSSHSIERHQKYCATTNWPPRSFTT